MNAAQPTAKQRSTGEEKDVQTTQQSELKLSPKQKKQPSSSKKTKASGRKDDGEGDILENYIDYSSVAPGYDVSHALGSGSSDSSNVPIRYRKLPAKLDTMLSTPQYEAYISWMPHGRSWKIHDTEAFVKHVLPTFFDYQSFNSFIRLVNAWGFRRKSRSGPDRNSYYHEFFLRGRPNLHERMSRLGTKEKKPMGEEPDLFSYPLLPALSAARNPQGVPQVATARQGTSVQESAAPSTGNTSLSSPLFTSVGLRHADLPGAMSSPIAELGQRLKNQQAETLLGALRGTSYSGNPDTQQPISSFLQPSSQQRFDLVDRLNNQSTAQQQQQQQYLLASLMGQQQRGAQLGNNPASMSTAASLRPSSDLNLLTSERLVRGLQQQQQQQGGQGQQQQSGMMHLLLAQALQQQANQERALEAQILLQRKQEQQRHINERQQQENLLIAAIQQASTRENLQRSAGAQQNPSTAAAAPNNNSVTGGLNLLLGAASQEQSMASSQNLQEILARNHPDLYASILMAAARQQDESSAAQRTKT